MSGYIEGVEREQTTLFPDRLEDWIGEDHPVRVIDAFVDALDFAAADFNRCAAAQTGRPGYHPSVLLKIFIYGYMNRVASSRRLEKEAGRNVEVMWLTGRLVPDHKTIADFRKRQRARHPQGLRRFVELCREIGVVAAGTVAIDGSKMKAVNNRDRNFTSGKVQLRITHLEQSAARYLEEMARADRREQSEPKAPQDRAAEGKTVPDPPGSAAPPRACHSAERHTRRPDIIDRSRREIDGNIRQRHWPRWIQRPDGCGYGHASDRGA